MKYLFPGYYHSPDFKKLFKECIFVFDSSVLLSIYELTKEESDNFFNAIENDKIKEKLWIPHQVALEYQRNRWKSISIQESSVNIKKRLTKLSIDIQNLEKNLKKLSMLQSQYINADEIQEGLNNIQTIIDELKIKKMPNLLLNDIIRNKIDKLFKNRIGNSYPKEKLEKIYSEGEKRFKNKIPPGYEDINKETIKKYGDLVLWKQIIDNAKLKEKPVVFVTNEKKNDWWFKGDTGNLLGPQADLIEEFYNETGQIFHMYRLSDFLKRIRKYLEIIVEDNTVEHVEDISDRNALKEFLVEDYLDPDAGLIEYKTPRPRTVNLMLNLIQEYEEEYEGAPINIIIDEMFNKYDIGRTESIRIIQNLKRRKMVFWPYEGHIKIL